MNPRSCTLSDLPIGRSASVVAVRGERAVARRLMEMGVLPGTTVRVVRVAPLGDPIEVRLRGYGLSLRRAEAAGIEVCDLDDAKASARDRGASEPGAT